MTKKTTSPTLHAMYQLQAEICSALASPIRLHILDILSDKKVTSSDLLQILGIPKANLAQHLSVLKDVGLVDSRREGQFQVLSLALPKIKEACSMVRAILVEKVAQQEKKNNQLIRELKSQQR